MSDGLLHRLADGLRRRRLDTPARLLVDAHRPLAPLLTDLGTAVAPLLRAAWPSGAERLLTDPTLLDRLARVLDDEATPRAGAD